MPEPRKGESRKDFVERCMSDEEAKRSFPKDDQRLAFCESRYDRKGKSEADTILVPEFARLCDYAGPWLIYPPAVEMYLLLAGSIDLAAHIKAAVASPQRVRTSFDSLEARNGKKVALVQMMGPMMKGESSLGGTSTIAIRRAIRQAVADSEVSAILLAIDSPGGTVAGTADLANEVRQATRRKPVYAHIDDLGASAAYWVASQADEVWANSPTALVGSIGTMVEVTESAGRAERLGTRERVFSTGPLKAIGRDHAITEEQATYLQGLVESLQTEFDAAVKKGRRMSAAQMAEVKSGAVYPAMDAQRHGLINGVRSLDATVEALSSVK